MKTMKLGQSDLSVPVIALGCMRINRVDRKTAESFVKTALELGANFFDHADVYGKGECESIFADIAGMSGAVREKMFLQSKCGIKGDTFNFSKQHILESVDGSLKRLKTDYLDVLLLHRPDALMEPEEVAEAFDILSSSGKVRAFGVSNQDPNLILLLQHFIKQPIVANQLQLSITNATMITQTMNMNMLDEMAIDRDNGVLNFCRLHHITIQPWSPFQYGFFDGTFVDNAAFPKLNAVLSRLAEKYGVSNTSIVMAWLLRHPAKMQPVTGTMNAGRVTDCVKAAQIELGREEWYEIYLAAGHRLP